MGNYLDYSLPETIDFSKGIESFGDALTDVMRRRQQRQMHEKEMALKQAHEDRLYQQNQDNLAYQNRIISQRENRDQRDFSQRQNVYRATQSERARKAASPQEAEAILADTALYDPATGKETARGRLTPGDIPTVGKKPKMPPPLGYDAEAAMGVGRVGAASIPGVPMPPEVRARMAGMAKTAESDLAGQEQAQKQHIQDLVRFGNAEKDAEARRPYTMSFGDKDPGVTFDFQTQRHAAKREAADMFLSSLPPNMSREDLEVAAFVEAGIQSGTIDPAKAGEAFRKERTDRMLEGGRGTRNEANIAGRETVAKINASRPRASFTVGAGNLDMRKFEQFQKDAERFAARYGVKADIVGTKQLDDGLAGISSGNQALEQGVVFQISRSMQGAGPLTKQDIEIIRDNISGKIGSLESALERLDTGHLGESEKRVFYGAIAARRKALAARMQSTRGEADKHFLRASSPYRRWVGDDMVESEIDAMFPGTQSTIDPATAPPSAPGKKKGRKGPPEAAAKKKATDKSLEDAMK